MKGALGRMILDKERPLLLITRRCHDQQEKNTLAVTALYTVVFLIIPEYIIERSDVC